MRAYVSGFLVVTLAVASGVALAPVMRDAARFMAWAALVAAIVSAPLLVAWSITAALRQWFRRQPGRRHG